MVITIDVRHVYKYPLEFVANAHFTKYPSKKEKFVRCIEVVEQSKSAISLISLEQWQKNCGSSINGVSTIEFAATAATLQFKIQVLNENAILLEEKAWLDLKQRRLDLESKNITWAKYADMTEKSVFKSDVENPAWTVFEQHGRINIMGLQGPLGRVIEMFAERFLHAGVQRGLLIMEDLLQLRYSQTGPGEI